MAKHGRRGEFAKFSNCPCIAPARVSVTRAYLVGVPAAVQRPSGLEGDIGVLAICLFDLFSRYSISLCWLIGRVP